MVPFLFFALRLWRLWGLCLALLLQALIFLTGNYTFFNLLTMSLCVLLFDDGIFNQLRLPAHHARTDRVADVAIGIVLVLSVSELDEMLFDTSPAPEEALVQIAGRFKSRIPTDCSPP